MTDPTKPKRPPGRPKKAAQLVLQDQHAPEGDPRAFLLAVRKLHASRANPHHTKYPDCCGPNVTLEIH